MGLNGLLSSMSAMVAMREIAGGTPQAWGWYQK